MKKLGRVVGINTALILGAALLTEIIFGGWVFGENYGLLPISRNFVRHYDISQLYGKTAAGEVMAVHKRDEHGLRGDYGAPGDIDILTVGGSTTNEILITEGETWSDRLAQAFADAGRRIKVANAGVDGQSVIGHILDFDLWFPKIPGLKPRYVLALLGINDTVRVTTDDVWSKSDTMVDTRRGYKRYLMHNSALYALFRNIRGILRARDAKLIHNQSTLAGSDWRSASPQPDLAAAEQKWAERLSVHEKRLRLLIGRIRAIGAKPIIVTQSRGDYRLRIHADGIQVLGPMSADGKMGEGPAHYANLSAVNRRAMTVCREEGAICIDLAAELFFEDGDHYDVFHTAPKGSARIGRYLYEKLKDVVK